MVYSKVGFAAKFVNRGFLINVWCDYQQPFPVFRREFETVFRIDNKILSSMHR